MIFYRGGEGTEGADMWTSSLYALCRILLHLRTSATFADAAQPPPPGAVAVMPENATNTARPLRAMVGLRAEVGADGLDEHRRRHRARERPRRCL